MCGAGVSEASSVHTAEQQQLPVGTTEGLPLAADSVQLEQWEPTSRLESDAGCSPHAAVPVSADSLQPGTPAARPQPRSREQPADSVHEPAVADLFDFATSGQPDLAAEEWTAGAASSRAHSHAFLPPVTVVHVQVCQTLHPSCPARMLLHQSLRPCWTHPSRTQPRRTPDAASASTQLPRCCVCRCVAGLAFTLTAAGRLTCCVCSAATCACALRAQSSCVAGHLWRTTSPPSQQFRRRSAPSAANAWSRHSCLAADLTENGGHRA